jgi:hypothetical protein
LIKFKTELQARAFLQQAESQAEQDKVTPEEKTRKLLYHLIIDSQAMTPDEQTYVIKSVALPEVRAVVAELFQAFATPRKLQMKECFI